VTDWKGKFFRAPAVIVSHLYSANSIPAHRRRHKHQLWSLWATAMLQHMSLLSTKTRAPGLRRKNIC